MSYITVFQCDYTKKQLIIMYGKLDGFQIPKKGEKVLINIPYKPGDIHGITSLIKSKNKSKYKESLYTLTIEMQNK